MESRLEYIYTLMKQEYYELALIELEVLQKEKFLYPKILVLKGICIILSDESDSYHYEDVEKLYREALKIDKEYPGALIELGHHLYASENKPQEAISFFEKAIEILKEQVTDAVLGLGKCIDETKSETEAIQFLLESKKLLDNKKINDLIEELKEDE